jgi:hypothetical protein
MLKYNSDACELSFQHTTDTDIVNAATEQKAEEGENEKGKCN